MAQIRETGVFCVNVVASAARDVMNASSGTHPAGVDEFALSGAAKAECETIDCPRVADAPASLECRMTRIVQLDGEANLVVFGEVTGVHLRDECLVEGRLDVTRYKPLSRLGYRDYAVVEEVFTLARPGE